MMLFHSYYLKTTPFHKLCGYTVSIFLFNDWKTKDNLFFFFFPVHLFYMYSTLFVAEEINYYRDIDPA